MEECVQCSTLDPVDLKQSNIHIRIITGLNSPKFLLFGAVSPECKKEKKAHSQSKQPLILINLILNFFSTQSIFIQLVTDTDTDIYCIVYTDTVYCVEVMFVDLGLNHRISIRRRALPCTFPPVWLELPDLLFNRETLI